MHSPALAIGWSLWARHRAVNIAVLAAIPVCAVLYRVFLAMIPERATAAGSLLHELPLTILPMALSLIWVLYVCAQTETDARKGFTGFPGRMFVLPVRTSFLVTCHMAYGIATMLLFHLAWAWLVFAPVGVHFAMRWPLILSATAMMVFQGGLWGLASFPLLRAVVLGVGGLCIGPLMVFASFASFPELEWDPRKPAYALITLAMLPLVYGATLVTVTGERRGGWQPWAPVRRLAQRVFDAVFLRQRPFASPAEALAWLEWRRKGWLIIAAMALSVAGSVMILPVQTLLGGAAGLPPWFALVVSFFWQLFMAASMGGLLAKPEFSGDVAMTPFHAIKPVTSGQIVLIKLRVAAMALVLGWLLAVPLILAMSAWANWRELWLNPEAQELAQWLRADAGFWWLAGMVLVTLVMTWNGIVDSTSVGLIGRTRVIGWTTFFRLACLVAVLSAGFWWYRRPEVLARTQPWLYAGLALLLLWKLAWLIRSFAAVRRRALWTPGQMRAGFALWFLVAASLVLGTTLCWWKLPLPAPLLLLAAVWFWPSGDLAQGALNLEANRHR